MKSLSMYVVFQFAAREYTPGLQWKSSLKNANQNGKTIEKLKNNKKIIIK